MFLLKRPRQRELNSRTRLTKKSLMRVLSAEEVVAEAKKT